MAGAPEHVKINQVPQVPVKVKAAQDFLEWCRECEVYYTDSEIGDKVKKLELDVKAKAVKKCALDVLQQYFGGESNFEDVQVPEGMPQIQHDDDDRAKAPVTTP